MRTIDVCGIEELLSRSAEKYKKRHSRHARTAICSLFSTLVIHRTFISTLLVFYHTDSNRLRRTAKANTSNIPIGFVAMFAGDLSNASIKSALVAAGWLPCDGASYSTSKYSDLAAVIGTTHGGDANNFNVPDLTGRFARGTTGRALSIPMPGAAPLRRLAGPRVTQSDRCK